jgi:OOP family OmpA-OmpF porin
MHLFLLRAFALSAGLFWLVGAGAQVAGQGDDGWYLGGGIRPEAPRAENTDIGYRQFGGYRFTRNWGVEVGYSDLGRGRGGDESALHVAEKFGYQTSAWTLAGTGVLPLGEAFSLQGRLGWSMASPDATLAAGGFGLDTSAPGFGLGSTLPRYRSTVLWGVGGQYDWNERVGLRVDYNNFGRLEDQNGTRSDLWSINAVVRF